MPTATIITFIAGSLFTLYLGLLELAKTQRNWYKIIISLLFFCVFLSAGLYDILDKDEGAKNDKKEVLYGISSSSTSLKDSIKSVVDSTKKAILDSILVANNRLKAQGDSLRKAFNNNKEIKLPILDLTARGEHKNPEIIYSSKTNTAICDFYLTNFGNDVATNIADYIIIVNYIGEKLVFNNVSAYENQIANKSTTIQPKETVMAEIGIGVPRENPFSNSVYIYLRLSYSDSKNKRMSPLRKIFTIKSTGIENIAAVEFDKIEMELRKNNLW